MGSVLEMEMSELLDQIQSRGLRAEIKSGVLMIGPGRLVDAETRELVRSYRADLMAYLACGNDSDVQWRVAVMLGQLLPLSWPCPVPTLHAKPDAEPNKEVCWSCGELLDVGEGNSYCCGACARAKDVALSLWLQRPAASAKVA